MKLLRKIAPFAISALMLGATLASAAAVDIASWKSTFTGTTTAVVVGTGVTDTGDLTAALAVANAASIDTSGTAGTATGSVEEEFTLDETLSDEFGVTLDDSDLSALQDTSVDIDDEDINVHDEIALGVASPAIETSSTRDKKYGADPVIEFAGDSVGYYYVFDEAYGGDDDDHINDDNPLTIDFMGKSLIITDMDKAADEITVQVGDEYTMIEGATKTVGTHSVLLDTVGEDTVFVAVDGVQKSIAEGNTVKFGSGDSAIRIKLKDALYSDKKDSKAILIIGEYAEKTYANGDEYVVPCSTPATTDCSKDDPDWVWDISLNDAADDFIGVVNAFVWNDASDPVLNLGDKMWSPGNFFSISPDSLKISDFGEFKLTYEEGIDLSDAAGDYAALTDESVFKLKGPDKKSLVVATHETDTLYFAVNPTDNNVEILYKDYDADGNPITASGEILADDEVAAADGAEFTLVYGDTEMAASLLDSDETDNEVYPVLAIDVNNDDLDDLEEAGTENDLYIHLNLDDATIAAATGFESIGIEAGAADEEDISFGLFANAAAGAGVAATELGTRDYDVLFIYGTILESVKDNLELDQVLLKLPKDEQKLTATLATSEVGESTSWTPVYDSDTGWSTKNIIAIGGTAVNKAARKILGLDEATPVYGTDAAWVDATGVDATGKGIIWMKPDVYTTGKYAMLVAGYLGDDTKKTADFLTIKGTTLASGKMKALIDTVNNVEAAA